MFDYEEGKATPSQQAVDDEMPHTVSTVQQESDEKISSVEMQPIKIKKKNKVAPLAIQTPKKAIWKPHATATMSSARKGVTLIETDRVSQRSHYSSRSARNSSFASLRSPLPLTLKNEAANPIYDKNIGRALDRFM